ncbi:arginine--tRNA ligase [Patescibacteria group bacterium]|nr:arginine--tRNA ligase [Patescibacteria group bacterium]
MKTIKTQLKETIKKSLDKTDFPAAVSFVVNYPRISQYGDYSTNVAMIIAKQLRKPPLEIAGELVKILQKQRFIKDMFEKVESIKPGFINFYFSPTFLSKQVSAILSLKDDYGKSDLGKKQKVQIEFISANPTGPLTIGNGRGGFYGDVLGNVLEKCGFKVIKEYLINDAGQQIEKLGHSVLQDNQAVYRGEYIDDLHNRLKGESDPYKVGQKAAKIILTQLIKPTVEKQMQIKFDRWFSEEKELRKTKKITEVLNWLKEKKYLYEKDNAWWFRSSDFGDNRDRVLIKQDGGSTYLAQDFAYLKNKFAERKFVTVIDIWGADHHGEVAGLLNAAKALGYKDQQKIILLQFVRLTKEGKEVRMSKRTGSYITMSELIETVGHDVARFFFLMYSPNSHIDFDMDLALEKSEKNPVYYVQYAFARLSSILNQPQVTSHFKKSPAALDYNQTEEYTLIKEVIKWPEILEEAASLYQVQLLPAYAISLADRFHQFYNNCRVINNDAINVSRVELVKLMRKIFLEVLSTIGVSAPEKM